MKTVGFVFHFRWILWTLGAAGLFGLVAAKLTKKDLAATFGRLERQAKRHFVLLLSILAGGYFLIATLAKFSQLHALALDAQDFWLFVDMLEQMKRGAFSITRFAPQGMGWIQHGAIRGYFTWTLALPLAWVTNATISALLYNPWTLAAGAIFLALLLRPRTGELGALVFAAAFLASSQVGKILMYEVHPEGAYPLSIFLWAWALGLGDGKIRLSALILAIVMGVGIREDSIFVLLPWAMWAAFKFRGSQRQAALIALFATIAVYKLNFLAVEHWVSGAWGPHQWDGSPVRIPAGPSFFKGGHWTSPGAAIEVARKTLDAFGGAWGTLTTFLKFLVSRPWLSLLALVPWVVLEWRFWFLTLPLAGPYSLVPGASLLWNYYSAPFLGTVWVAGSLPERRDTPPRWHLLWVLLAACLLGGGGPEFDFPTPEAVRIRQETEALLPCLAKAPGNGMAPAALLGLVPRERIWTDRIPRSSVDWAQIQFAIFAPELGRYETPRPELEKFHETLSRDPHWSRWDSDCRPAAVANDPRSRVILFVRNS